MADTVERRRGSSKRPRSPSSAVDYSQIASKMPKAHSNHLQINYLARQFTENLPLVSSEDSLPAILRLIGEYDGVLHRHESIAGNLGACPLGPILVKRFERLFDGPPKVLKSNNKDGSPVSWLDVVEFAKNKPDQFNLEKTRNGARVCQIHVKQCRVEISEEDFVLIASGMPQRMIPPQPISEDEEKELGALEILEKNLGQIIQLADQVSARARQLNHRLKNRKNAIVTRRENDTTLASHAQRSISPWKDTNGKGAATFSHSSNGHSRPHSPTTGFVAVNSRPEQQQQQQQHFDESLVAGPHFAFSQPITDNVTIINGTSVKNASPDTRAELMKKFFTTSERRIYGSDEEVVSQSQSQSQNQSQSGRQTSRKPRASDPGEYAGPYAPVAIPHTPSSLLPPPKTTGHQYDREDGGPFKTEMVNRMEDLQRGEKILPPCDRCRRLHMDCLKNLTACMGCTKKHAKCSWKDVKLEELRELYPHNPRKPQDDNSNPPHLETANESQTLPVLPNDILTLNPDYPPPPPPPPASNPEGLPPISRPASEPQQVAQHSPPRRSLSENMVNTVGESTKNSHAIYNNEPHRVNGNSNIRGFHDQDATETLAQAIMDTVEFQRARAAAAEREGGTIT